MASTGYTLAHPADLDGETSYTFTCGKIDAGIAVLIGSHAHLIEFPSLLLPPGCEPGSIVSITCTRDHAAEKSQADSFWDLQSKIVEQFGASSPQAPNLRLRSVTQTSVTLEWDKLELARCKLLSLSIWKNGQRLGTLPNPINNTSTKLSGLDLDTEYNFYLVMKTTGGSFNSQKVTVKTHSLNDTSGINVCFGIITPEELEDQAKEALEELNARWSDKIQIDTTHFVCTVPYQPQRGQNKTTQPNTFPSLEYQRALQLSIPVVQPSWLQACLHERKMVPIAPYYLGAQPPPLNTSPPGATSGRSRSASKTAGQSLTPISPKATESNFDSPTDSARTSRQHERTMSAPVSSTSAEGSSKNLDQVGRTSPGLAPIDETKDQVDFQTQPVNGNLQDPSHNNLQQDSVSNSNLSNETDSEKTLRFSRSTSLSLSVDQPSVPTPPKGSGLLSDILKENVDSPAEHESNSVNPPDLINQTVNQLTNFSERTDHSTEEKQQQLNSSISPTNSKNDNTIQSLEQAFSNSGIVDDGEDDPFSAASPTISYPSPSGEEIEFTRSSHHHPRFQVRTPNDNISPMTLSPNPSHSFSSTIPRAPETPEDHPANEEDARTSEQPTELTLLPESSSSSSSVTEGRGKRSLSSDIFEDISLGGSTSHQPQPGVGHPAEPELEGSDEVAHSIADSRDTFFSTDSPSSPTEKPSAADPHTPVQPPLLSSALLEDPSDPPEPELNSTPSSSA